ncbi:hypothetical protein ACFVY4_27105 [Streptomyces sp. NPDC058299]|uniref:hypothetical protein n=1 Tax=Streptomyces sp. NPDC058299 TaxID=3346435 RepID=UPI0036EEBA5B
MPQDDQDPYLDTAQVGERIGVVPETVRLYLKRTRKRAAASLPVRPADFPLPDSHARRSPLWRQSTIDTWLVNRPGRGRRTPDD